MTTDTKEMLQYAAKAAGIKDGNLHWTRSTRCAPPCRHCTSKSGINTTLQGKGRAMPSVKTERNLVCECCGAPFTAHVAKNQPSPSTCGRSCAGRLTKLRRDERMGIAEEPGPKVVASFCKNCRTKVLATRPRKFCTDRCSYVYAKFLTSGGDALTHEQSIWTPEQAVPDLLPFPIAPNHVWRGNRVSLLGVSGAYRSHSDLQPGDTVLKICVSRVVTEGPGRGRPKAYA